MKDRQDSIYKDSFQLFSNSHSVSLSSMVGVSDAFVLETSGLGVLSFSHWMICEVPAVYIHYMKFRLIKNITRS